MSSIVTACLGILFGIVLTDSLQDHHWWPYLRLRSDSLRGDELSHGVMQRALAHYKAGSEAPPYFISVILLVSTTLMGVLVRGIISDKINRPKHFLSFLIFLGGTGIPFITKIVPAEEWMHKNGASGLPSEVAQKLHETAFWHMVVGITTLLNIALQCCFGSRGDKRKLD
ncbi:uncharacterized protein EV422DRAFT_264877 [Fimicolochytrium jonesii]|uniref:uncharacterized protein n=1 Tax=Fimicolochytrium jonesii TaxID=1396493 RepID=UPI0022FE4F2B|nr:uncharacterized protein EV422DRAFT_264877 [Fimicolochytrium jonesii]KAI8816896.1 hypothetical protein EV422DRAFT_264877 [Fimicolochytrium jonesii]